MNYLEFMCNADNAYNCAECPENQGFDAWPETRKPCGQFTCWVECHCSKENKTMTFREWMFEKYGIEGDPTDMYEVDPDAYNELEEEYYKETNK